MKTPFKMACSVTEEIDCQLEISANDEKTGKFQNIKAKFFMLSTYDTPALS